ncbi:MAG: DUF4062 domain-containing protein [Marinicaulis sp.]|nr:DUF4062 domain-containing protein [Marinicaulis sp.]
MKFFISSVNQGFEDFRLAVEKAVKSLDHEVVRSEDFASSPASPRVACLAGVRESDGVILLLGSRYGDEQSTGKSAVHEEFEQAKSNNLFLFIQKGVEFENKQAKLVEDARDWVKGTYSNEFTSPESLTEEVVRAIHRWERENQSGNLDAVALVEKARSNLLSAGRQSYSGTSIAVSLVGGANTTIVRPSVLDSHEFKSKV